MKFIISLFYLFLSITSFAQEETYKRVKIDLQEHSIKLIARLGIHIDHAEYRRGVHIITDLCPHDIATLDKCKIKYEVVVDDLQSFYLKQIREHTPTIHNRASSNISFCHQRKDYKQPEHFTLGSMGGYFTYEEYIEHVDSMVKLYPHIISAKDSLDTNSVEGRPIYYFNITSDIEADSTKPKIFYNALHHAREAGSLSNIIYFMWYLLENYESDPEIQYLVDHTQMYFVPCVNPDGYIYNQTTKPDGAGMWRKNRRDNQDGTFGVDLNRNYGHHWGYDNSGSSPSSSSDTYRGTSAFSEPETQAIRDFCIEHQFKITLNYHTYGNLLIYPWGYDYSLYTPDSAEYVEMARLMTQDNSFVYGTGDQTVNYITNGDSDDWMYGDQGIFSMTPELGPSRYGFWPPSDQIVPICKTAMNQNIKAAHLLLNYGEIKERSPSYINEKSGHLNFHFKAWGLQDSSQFILKFNSLTEGLTFTTDSIIFSNPEHYKNYLDSIEYSLTTNEVELPLIYSVSIDNGKFIKIDTFEKHFSTPFVSFYDDASTLDQWTSENGDWDTYNGVFHSNPESSTYGRNQRARLIMKQPVDLTLASSAYLNIKMKWDVEANFDYLQIGISTDQHEWYPLCGKYSRNGGQHQDDDKPITDGRMDSFVLEEINLNNYLGQNIYLRFYLNTDYANHGKGVEIDEIKIMSIIDSSIFIDEIENGYYLSQNYPNPSKENTFINYKLPNSGEHQFELIDIQGKIIWTQNIENNQGNITLDLSQYPSGNYFYRISSSHTQSKTFSLIIP